MVKFSVKLLFTGVICMLVFLFPAKLQAQKKGLELYAQHKFMLAQMNLAGWYKSNANTTDVKALSALADCYWINRNYKEAYTIYSALESKAGAKSNNVMLKRLSDLRAMKGNYTGAAKTLNGIDRFKEKKKGFDDHALFLKDSANWHLSYLDLNTSSYMECLPYVYNNEFIVTTNGEDTKSNYRSEGNYSKLQYMNGEPSMNSVSGRRYNRGSINNFSSDSGSLFGDRLAYLHENADAPLQKDHNYDKHGDKKASANTGLVPLNIDSKFLFNIGCMSVQSSSSSDGNNDDDDDAASSSGEAVAYFVANDNGTSSVKGYSKYDSVEVPTRLYKGTLDQADNLTIRNVTPMTIDGFSGRSILIHASVSRDGQLLVFSGKRSVKSTDYNLFYATRTDDNEWGDVVELGKDINTFGDEVFPQLQNDGTLCFSSDGLGGMGALDAFYIPSFYHNGKVNANAKPLHLGSPLNSAFDDYGVFITKRPTDSTYSDLNGMEGYYTSNRMGSDDIFYFRYGDKTDNGEEDNTSNGGDNNNGGGNTIKRCGHVYGKYPQGSIKLLSGAVVTLYQDETTEIAKDTTDAFGGYCFNVSPNQAYGLKAEKEGWEPSAAGLTPSSQQEGFPNIFLDSLIIAKSDMDDLRDIGAIESGERIVKVWVLHHEFDRTDIVPKDQKVIDSLTQFCMAHPTATVKIFSTADCYGSIQHNNTLAKNRSEFIKNVLLSRGLDRIVDVNSAGIGERVLPCPEVRNEENIRRQEANRYTRIFITLKKQ